MQVTPSLNSEQLVAARHMDGPLLVIAGAGSGKTRVVTQRIAFLIQQGISPSSIVALTFTNKAASEMRSRLYQLCKMHILVSTFHALGAKILRESIMALRYPPSFTIIDEKDQERLLKAICQELNVSERQLTLRELKWRISSAKNELLLPASYPIESRDDELFLKIYTSYQRKLFQYANVDFDDLLLLPNRLFREEEKLKKEYQERWNYLLIDEYQDTNHAQYQLAKHLVGTQQNLFVVGDPDQSIYSWRGADIGNILSFEQDFPGAKVIKLEQNYRSTQVILQAANGLIQKNGSRYEKQLFSTLDTGELVESYQFESDRQEAKFIAQTVATLQESGIKSIAIFYRTNGQSRGIEDALIEQRVAYQIVGGISFYERKEIKDVIALLRLLVSERDFLSFERVVKAFKFALGAKSLEKMRHQFENKALSIHQLCQSILQEGAIRLTTKQKEGLSRFCQLLTQLKQLASQKTLSALIQEAILASGYLNLLQEDPESFEERKDNLDSLLAKAVEQEDEGQSSLLHFLQDVALKIANEEGQQPVERVYLMTLHNSKGLEFDAVFIAGMEEELFPHIHSQAEGNIEEERRLCYVGMTRARRRLILSSAKRRFLWGQQKIMRPSRFLREIPSQYVKRPLFYQPFDKVLKEESKPFALQLEQGDRVFHSEFGNGTINKLFESSLGPMAEVTFAHDQKTRLMALQYASLQKVS